MLRECEGHATQGSIYLVQVLRYCIVLLTQSSQASRMKIWVTKFDRELSNASNRTEWLNTTNNKGHSCTILNPFNSIHIPVNSVSFLYTLSPKHPSSPSIKYLVHSALVSNITSVWYKYKSNTHATMNWIQSSLIHVCTGSVTVLHLQCCVVY